MFRIIYCKVERRIHLSSFMKSGFSAFISFIISQDHFSLFQSSSSLIKLLHSLSRVAYSLPASHPHETFPPLGQVFSMDVPFWYLTFFSAGGSTPFTQFGPCWPSMSLLIVINSLIHEHAHAWNYFIHVGRSSWIPDFTHRFQILLR